MPVLEIEIDHDIDAAGRDRLAGLVRAALADGATGPEGPWQPAIDLARRYLAAMEARDLDAARACLADDFEMRFPGTGPMRQLEELLAWAAPRYRRNAKTYDGADALPHGPRTVVYLRGRLSGIWPDGSPFEGIRFIDRFEVEDGLIRRQDVWNDMAEVRP